MLGVLVAGLGAVVLVIVLAEANARDAKRKIAGLNVLVARLTEENQSLKLQLGTSPERREW